MKAASLSGDVRLSRFARCWPEPVSAMHLENGSERVVRPYCFDLVLAARRRSTLGRRVIVCYRPTADIDCWLEAIECVNVNAT